MSSSASNSDLIDQVIVEYLDRKQQGESPSIEEYCKKYPLHAAEIQSLLRTVDIADADLMGQKILGAGEGVDETDGKAVDLEPEQLPEKLGAYRITGEIGRGGMGVVYRAVHEELERPAALKVLPQRASRDSRSVERFLLEGRSIASMHHSNIVPLFEVGHAEGRFFLAMQLIDGESLETWISRLASSAADAPRVDFFRVARIGRQAAEALHYAHRRGVIHRDIKPSNLLLDENDVIWLTDFGLAKSDNENLTQTGDIVGTLRYMAPERFRGQCDERADIYALGLTLYELLALRPAFDSADRLDVIRKISNQSPPRLRTLNRQIPRDLETIVMKAIDREPKARYLSAKDMALDLSNFVNDLPIQARRLSLAEQALRWSRKNKTVAAAMFLAIVSLVTLAVVSTTNSIREKGLRIAAENLTKESTAKSELLQRNLYYAHINLASGAADSAIGQESIRSRLQETHPDQVGADFRGWEWYFLKGLINQEQFVSSLQSGRTTEVDFSPDGSKLVNVVNGWGFQIRDGFTGKVLDSKQTGSCSTVQWSPDGQTIAQGDFRGDIHFWDVNTLELKSSILSEIDFEVLSVRFSPDGRRIASTGREQPGGVWDVQSGALLKNFPMAASLQFSPDGKRLAVGNDKGIWVFDAQSFEHLCTWEDGKYKKFVWDPDGQHLVTFYPFKFWNIDSQRVVLEPTKIAPYDYIATWRPGQDHLLFVDSTGFRLWDKSRQIALRTFFGHPGAESATWSSDGLRFATSGRETVRIWSTGGFSPVWTEELRGYNESIAWSADGNQVVTNTSMNAIHFFDATNREMRFEQSKEPIEGHRVWAVATHPQKPLLAYGGQEKQVSILDTQTGITRKFDCPGGEIKKLAWGPDGKLAAICWLPHFDINDRGARKTANNLVVWDRQGKLLGVKPTGDGFGRGLAWHPDGSKIATLVTDGVIRIWNSESLEPIRHWPTDPEARVRENSELSWSPDGRHLASAHLNAVFIWEAETGQCVKKLDEIRDDFRTLDWSSDGRMLAAGSYTSLGIWNMSDLRVAIKLNYGVTQVRWSPDGRRLACCSFQELNILDATRGYELEAMDHSIKKESTKN